MWIKLPGVEMLTIYFGFGPVPADWQWWLSAGPAALFSLMVAVSLVLWFVNHNRSSGLAGEHLRAGGLHFGMAVTLFLFGAYVLILAGAAGASYCVYRARHTRAGRIAIFLFEQADD